MRVVLVPHDDAWAVDFAWHAERVRTALGERALLVEHVGSTAVPGLVAKPVLDMILAVADSAAEAEYVPSLEAAGYRLRFREPGWYEHRLLGADEADVNLHVFTRGCAEIDRMVRFRDRLREACEDRERYERAKQALAERDWPDIQGYADAKAGVVADILARASATLPR